jgi:8-oxo-dGTP diphosphatase
MPGKWEFPGGKLRSGETAEQAIIREIAEELGCHVQPRKTFASNTHDYANFSITLIPLLCELIDGEPKALEHAEILWAVPSELAKLDWAEADIPILEAYLESRGAGSHPVLIYQEPPSQEVFTVVPRVWQHPLSLQSQP